MEFLVTQFLALFTEIDAESLLNMFSLTFTVEFTQNVLRTWNLTSILRSTSRYFIWPENKSGKKIYTCVRNEPFSRKRTVNLWTIRCHWIRNFQFFYFIHPQIKTDKVNKTINESYTLFCRKNDTFAVSKDTFYDFFSPCQLGYCNIPNTDLELSYTSW